MWRLRAGLRVLGLAAAVVVGAGLAVLVPAADGPVPTAHAQLGGSAEPVPPVAEQGMIVAVDHGNDRLQVFYPDGTFAFKVGAWHPQSIDVGPDGKIVVVGSGAYALHSNGTHAFGFGGGAGVGAIGSNAQVAVGPDGRIVVADYTYDGNDVHPRVQVFSPDGEFESVFDAGFSHYYSIGAVAVGPDGLIVAAHGGQVRAFHPNGTLAFWFSTGVGNAHHLAVGPDGEIVTIEGGYDNVLRVYSPNGTTLSNGTLSMPSYALAHGFERARSYAGSMSDVDVGADGRIVVGNRANNTISVYHPNATQVLVDHPNGTRAPLTFGGYGLVHREFDRPTDAAVGPDGRIVVAEPGSRIISVFHPNGTPAFSFGSYRHGDDGFYEPHQVAVAPDGRIVVGDTGKHRILVFEPDGTPAFAFGSYDRGGGGVRGVRDVAVGPDGRVVVVDGSTYGGGRVQVFSPDGSTVFELLPDDRRYFRWTPDNVAVAPDGRIVVAARNGGVYVFDPNGTETFGFGLGQGAGAAVVAVAPDGRIVAVKDSRSQMFSPDGEFVFATEIDVDAVSVAVGPSREIVVVDDDADRVQVFNPNGTFAFSLLPDLSEGRFHGIGAIAVGPVMPPPRGDPEPLWTSIEPEDGGAPILRNFTGAGDAANVTIDVGSLAEGPGGADALNGSESSIVVFPAVETVVAASFAEVTFPPNVTASHVPAGGLLGLRVATALPTAEQVQAALGRSANGSGPELVVLLQSVIEVGADQARIAFDLPIRIALDGAAGGRAFYIEGANGTIVPIDVACAADDGDAVHRQLGGAGECQMDAEDGGTAKIVYTYHLTKFGTVSAEGPVPVRTDAVDPPVPALPPVVVPVPPSNGTLPFGGGGGGGGNATNGTAGQPVVVPPPQVVVPDPMPQPALPGPPADTCAVGIDFPALDMSAQPGEYSAPVEQVVFNAGSLPLARVEVMATPWHDGSGPPVPPPMPGVPPAYSGPTQGRTAGAFTAYMIASLPASVTEVRDDESHVGPGGARFFSGGGGGQVVYEPLADDGSGTAVLEGLEPGWWAPLSFRLNLTAYDGLLAGALVQSVTYQAECVPPSPVAAPPSTP